MNGFLPVRIALPSLVGILCGPGTAVPQSILRDAFLDYISNVERLFFKEALDATTFTPEMQGKVLNTLSRFGCRQLPTYSIQPFGMLTTDCTLGFAASLQQQ